MGVSVCDHLYPQYLMHPQLSTTTMVSRTATERQILDLKNAESTTAWTMSFVAKFCAEKKEDKVNTDGTVQDLQVTNLSMCGQDAIFKLRPNES